MKFNIFRDLLISILISSLVLNRRIQNERIKNNLFFKDTEGSGSWDTFFDCPRINIADDKGTFASQGSAKIYAKNIENPSSVEDKLGLVFDFNSSPGPLLVKVGTLISGNKYYIPYRYFDANLYYDNPSQDNKSIGGSFRSDDKKLYKIKIEFPFKRTGWFISDDEGRRILNAINTQSTNQKNIVTNLKSNINGQTSRYIEKKTQLDAALKGSNEFKALITKKESDAGELKKKIDSSQSNSDSLKKTIDDARKNLDDQISKFNDLQNSINMDSKTYNEIMDAVEKSKNDSIPIAKNINDIQAAVDESTKNLDTYFNTFISTAPIRKDEINTAKSAYQKSDAQGVVENLKKIYP